MGERQVYLVRHGAVENPQKVLYGRLPGFHLSREGEDSIRHLGDRLKLGKIEFSKIYTSPMERTMETAKIIGDSLGVSIEKHDELLEVDCKILEGRNKWKQLKLYLVHGFNIYSPYYIKNGVEPAVKITERMKGFVGKKFVETKGNFIIVSHGDPIHLLLWSYLHPGQDFAKAFLPTKFVHYPKRGQAMVLSFSEEGKFLRFTHF